MKIDRLRRAATVAGVLACWLGVHAAAQQQPPDTGRPLPPTTAPQPPRAAQPPAGQGRGQAQPPGQRGQGRGAPPARPEPLPFEYHVGYESIFDGQTLKGWDGDSRFWRVENGAIVGQTTPENKLDENTFLIWRGGEPADFELKLEFRINATNSGIQFRSVHLPQGSPDGRGGELKGKWVMKGYQYDIDFANTFTGQIYEERGRGFLAMRGQMTYVPPDGSTPKILGSLQVGADDLKGVIKINDWNQAEIMARGNRIVQILNGHVVSMVVDDDAKGRAMSGLIGFQMHVGEPMKVEFRNIWLKKV
jgi:Domain of Unknown Function (DUF1080)